MVLKRKILILAICCLAVVDIVTAHLNWPLCKQQSDLPNQFNGILEGNSNNAVAKREVSWPLSCLHASIIKDENGESFFSFNVYSCCALCDFPKFSLCTLAGLPDWLCGSEAYECVFSCRDEESALEAMYKSSDSGSRGKRTLEGISENEVRQMKLRLRHLRTDNQCYKKKCQGNECCLMKTCVSIKKLTKQLRKKRRGRGNRSRRKTRKTK
ncbi:uncharacterized protein LOC114518432 [Dendronephthya gigantea]|uniref:uncharacterized protein LOC114518432 n=1 Tax=Dendronephthya gigantea TaxID=151771 RepID=UPI00106ACB82|nr:uncharacterized protein LOC114518432 [Dendronephthya gigantea]